MFEFDVGMVKGVIELKDFISYLAMDIEVDSSSTRELSIYLPSSSCVWIALATFNMDLSGFI